MDTDYEKVFIPLLTQFYLHLVDDATVRVSGIEFLLKPGPDFRHCPTIAFQTDLSNSGVIATTIHKASTAPPGLSKTCW